MKIAIIGGSGFIGRQLIHNLRFTGFQLVSIDIIENPECESIICNILNPSDIQSKLEGFDYVYLLAAVSEASKNTSDPVNSMNLNVMGTVNVLNACVFNKVKKIIFASTVWVYDACNEIEVDENSIFDPNYKGNLYTTSKICSEMLIKSYNKTFGLDYTIFRLGTAYGPNCNPRTAVASFVKNAINGDSIKVFGDGNGFRSFMHVSDHAKLLAHQVLYHGLTINGTINADGPEQVSLNQILDLLRGEFPNLSVEYIPIDGPAYAGKKVSCKKRDELGVPHPKVKFEEGLKDYVQWFKNINSSTAR